MALVLKKLSRPSSVFVPYLRRSPDHPRHFIAEVRSMFKEASRRVAFGCPTDIVPEIFNRILYRIPHTLRVTSRVKGFQAYGRSGGDVDTTLCTPMKFSLNIPGIEKFTETPEYLYIHIDMGLDKNWVRKDLDISSFKATLQDDIGLKNIMTIDGYVQKLDIRRHYTAFICLPPNIKAIKGADDNFLILPENGGVVVTIPKQQEIIGYLTT